MTARTTAKCFALSNEGTTSDKRRGTNGNHNVNNTTVCSLEKSEDYFTLSFCSGVNLNSCTKGFLKFAWASESSPSTAVCSFLLGNLILTESDICQRKTKGKVPNKYFGTVRFYVHNDSDRLVSRRLEVDF